MHHRHETKRLFPPRPLAAALMLASLVVAFTTPVLAQEGQQSGQPQATGQMGNQGIFDPRATNRGYYASYDELRPWLHRHHHRMYGPPPAFPNTSIYGEDSRYYGGPNYGLLRPGGRMGMGPMMEYDVPPAPRTGIYGRDSRLYGGPNYNLLR